MSLAVDEMELDELAVDEMAVNDFDTPPSYQQFCDFSQIKSCKTFLFPTFWQKLAADLSKFSTEICFLCLLFEHCILLAKNCTVQTYIVFTDMTQIDG